MSDCSVIDALDPCSSLLKHGLYTRGEFPIVVSLAEPDSRKVEESLARRDNHVMGVSTYIRDAVQVPPKHVQ